MFVSAAQTQGVYAWMHTCAYSICDATGQQAVPANNQQQKQTKQTNLVVETAAAAELAPRHAAGNLDGPVVGLHLRPLLAALQALRSFARQRKR